jgi:GntR family transcriptional regulator, transcriptional repressor for pyruvate dehydrogenase complex
VAAQFYEIRKETIRHARDLRESAEMHRRIYRAVRAHDPAAARDAMSEHLQAAQHAQTLELRSGADDGAPAGDHQEE